MGDGAVILQLLDGAQLIPVQVISWPRIYD